MSCWTLIQGWLRPAKKSSINAGGRVNCRAVLELLGNQFSSVQSLSQIRLFPIPWTAVYLPVQHQLLDLTQPHVHQVSDAIQPSHSLSSLLLWPSIFPSIRVFSNDSVLPIRWPKYWSFLPMNIQDLFPLGLTGLISLWSKGLPRVFSGTTVQSINSSMLSFPYSSTLTSIHDYWKNHSFDYTDLCRQSDVYAF